MRGRDSGREKYMRMLRFITTGPALVLALIPCSVSDHAAVASEQPTPAIQAQLDAHRRLTVEGERASRAMRPSVSSAARARNGTIAFPSGIIQFPINTAVTVPLVKQVAALPPSVPPCPYTPGLTPPMRTASLVKVFAEVAWHICVTDMGLKSLWVGPVHRAPNLNGPWTTVIHQAGLAEIFVPYHRGDLRLYDLAATANLDQVTAQDAGANGSLIYLTNETIPTVVAEVRDRGVAWLCKETTATTRRGQELVLWGVADGGNYDNIVEYTFRDDGGITFRTGNTGYNSPGQPTQPHTHNALWRVDIDVNGAPDDTAAWLEHNEPPPPGWPYPPTWALDFELPFVNEGARQWTDQIASLLVTDTANNAFGNVIGYEFTPLQHAVSRHFGPDESWTRSDVFVTRYHPEELGWTTTWMLPEAYLMAYLNSEPTRDQDLVVWVKTAAHHHPTDEDRSANDRSTNGFTGVTLAHWSGFTMAPYNSFNANPLGGPARCGP